MNSEPVAPSPPSGRDEPTSRRVEILGGLAIHAGPLPSLGERHLQLTFPSAFVHGDDAVEVLSGRLRSWGWVDVDQIDLFTHCAHEAVMNAIAHGNRCRLELPVEVGLWATREDWHLVVHDRGRGFRREDVLRAFRGVRRYAGHGRGILIMLGWLDDLAYHEGGRSAVLTRRRADAG